VNERLFRKFDCIRKLCIHFVWKLKKNRNMTLKRCGTPENVRNREIKFLKLFGDIFTWGSHVEMK
jgi:hypothetical protein